MRPKVWIFHFVAGLTTSAALAGLLLLAAALGPVSYVPLDISDALIRLTPGAVATQGIESLGPLAKQLIELTGTIVFLIACGLVGLLYGRLAPRPWLPAGLLLALAPLTLTLVAQLLGGGLRRGLPGLALTALLYALWGLALAAMVNRLAAPTGQPVAVDGAERRAFLLQSGGILIAVAVGSAALSRLIARSGAAQVVGAGQALPTSAPTTLPPTVAPTTAAPAASAATAGQATTPTAASTPIAAFAPAPTTRAPFNTNETLYVISSSTRDPEVSRDAWRLEIGGAVNHPFSLSYADLLTLERVDQTSTLECISNEVGNYLIGTCIWNGVRLRDLLEQAGVQDGVIDIKLTAAEGYTESIPLAKALDPTSLIVYGIDGEALSVKHGFPARLIVPGLYGEKNVKWLTTIEAVREDYQGYWQQRGWTDRAIIETTSVIDTNNPYLGNHPPLQRENGSVPLGGIAFAGNRGIRMVELQIDDGDWHAAQLDPQNNPLTWRIWRYDWKAEPGRHTLRIRATDGTGALQTDMERGPHPDGATGLQSFSVEVI